MPGAARTSTLVLSVLMMVGSAVAPANAGMKQDLADCTAADRKTSADACTRVMNSGRLPRNQFYIGHYNRGWSYFNAGAFDEALADFDKSIGYKPGYADTYMSRAQVQHERGARDESLADLDRYLEKRGEVAEAYLNRARLFRRRDELARAFSELQRAGSLDPGDTDVLVLRALVLSDMGEQSPAHIEADKAIAAKPDAASAFYARAVIAMRDEALAAAAADIEKALSIKKDFPAAHVIEGEIHERRNETDAAIASFRRALDFSPRSLDGRVSQEKARTRLAALDGAEPLAAKVAASSPDAAPPAPSNADCRRFIPYARVTVAVECEK